MKHNPQLKVFSIIAVAILVISFSIAAKVSINSKQPISIATGVDTIDEHIEDKNTSDENTSSENDDNTQTQTVKSYTNGYSCMNDSFSVVNAANAMKMTSKVTAVADIMGIGKSTQNVTEIKTKTGDYFFKETWAKCDVSLGQNYYRYFYTTDMQNFEYRKTSSVNSQNLPNWGGTSIIYTTKDEILQKYDLICFDYFDFIPNKQNSKLVRFDRTSSNKYYIISFSYNVNSISSTYVRNMLAEGGISSISYKSIAVTYYVEKSTLYIRKGELDLIYSITKGIKVDITMHQDLYVNSINVPFEPVKPTYCY